MSRTDSRQGIKRLVVITGPTASGKTALAIEVARSLHSEIISADSRQIYRGMPISTARPSDSELAAVRHHFIETLDISQYYSAAQYETDVLALLDSMSTPSATAVMCGGSMMYVDAVCHGIDEMPTISDNVRARVVEMRKQHGDEGLLAYLEIVDPETFRLIDRKNMRRVMHAVELCIQSGRPYSELCTGQSRKRPFDILKFVIDMPRQQLFDRINRRVDAMVTAGMEEEARRLYPLRSLNALNTVGLKEWFAYFDGKLDRPSAIERIKKNTRVYAKKQMTWFARDAEAIHLDSSRPLLTQVIEKLGPEAPSSPAVP